MDYGARVVGRWRSLKIRPGPKIPALLEKVTGLEVLLDSNRTRLADSQPHSIDLKTELDASHQQQGGLTTLIETMREQNQTLIRALPPATTEPKRSWKDWFGFGC